jgi:hypothetical protein
MVTSMHALILSAKFHTSSISLSRDITKTSFHFLALAASIQMPMPVSGSTSHAATIGPAARFL